MSSRERAGPAAPTRTVPGSRVTYKQERRMLGGSNDLVTSGWVASGPLTAGLASHAHSRADCLQ